MSVFDKFFDKNLSKTDKSVIIFNTNMLCNKKLYSFRVKPDISLSGRIRMQPDGYYPAGYRMEPDIRYIPNNFT